MSPFIAVMLKELREIFRDRRMVFTGLLLGPLLIPLLVIGGSSMVQKRMTTQLEGPLELPVVGAEHAPNLVAWLRGQNIRIVDPPSDPEAAILDETYRVILRIPAEYGDKWRGSEPARVEILHDSTRQDAQIPLTRLVGALGSYQSTVGSMRLLARGISPTVSAPVQIATLDLSTPEARSGQVIGGMLAYILILSAFLGGAYLVIDATAGERERQSLEPLLATPAGRGAIMSGKIAAAVVFGLISLCLLMVAFGVSMKFGPAAALKVDASLLAVLKLLAILVPLLMIGTCLLTLIAASVKSVKEAQSYMSILMFLPIIPVMALILNPVKAQTWMFAVPFLGQHQMIINIARKDLSPAIDWLVYFGASFGLAAVLWLIAVRLYHREKLAISA